MSHSGRKESRQSYAPSRQVPCNAESSHHDSGRTQRDHFGTKLALADVHKELKTMRFIITIVCRIVRRDSDVHDD